MYRLQNRPSFPLCQKQRSYAVYGNRRDGNRRNEAVGGQRFKILPHRRQPGQLRRHTGAGRAQKAAGKQEGRAASF